MKHVANQALHGASIHWYVPNRVWWLDLLDDSEHMGKIGWLLNTGASCILFVCDDLVFGKELS